ncbi:ABC transporter ATP-binding protein [Microlunatus speluncae]|uniref:ABC transporter ATP-binding protein n=1 Tax=Microlunatus speluncae TaxID=2594267 RepID=UPI001FE2A16A|nr:ABC transporter ATP-binding protein [Microlunatus speluncae]
MVSPAGLTAELRVSRGTFRLDLELAAEPGEVVALLGPNGAGKSTALRALAGLVLLDDGRIELGGRLLAGEPPGGGRLHLPAHRRPIGVVFQDYLLFPHLSALDNVAFGPRCRGRSKPDARAAAAALLESVGLADQAQARPRRLSGGQAQRVALARALAVEPELLLLDEPLAALDARTRLEVRGLLRRRLADFAGVTVLVTHDPVDAAVLSDRVVVIEAGAVVQTGTPAEIARHPATDYVARLVGLNLLTGTADGTVVSLDPAGEVRLAHPGQGPVQLAFPPSAVSLFLDRPTGTPRNLWYGTVAGLEPHGDQVRVEIADVPGPGSVVLAEITPAAVAELALEPGSGVWAGVKASAITAYPRG